MDFQTQETNKRFPELTNYQPFYATQGKTTKSGCGFYVKKGLKLKSRRDLDHTYDDENEFQSCRIEILNEKESNTIIGVTIDIPRKTQMIFLI